VVWWTVSIAAAASGLGGGLASIAVLAFGWTLLTNGYSIVFCPPPCPVAAPLADVAHLGSVGIRRGRDGRRRVGAQAAPAQAWLAPAGWRGGAGPGLDCRPGQRGPAGDDDLTIEQPVGWQDFRRGDLRQPGPKVTAASSQSLPMRTGRRLVGNGLKQTCERPGIAIAATNIDEVVSDEFGSISPPLGLRNKRRSGVDGPDVLRVTLSLGRPRRSCDARSLASHCRAGGAPARIPGTGWADRRCR